MTYLSALHVNLQTTNQSVLGKRTQIIEERSRILSAEKLQPGQRRFIDHFECSTRGRKFAVQGVWNKQRNAKVSNPLESFKGGCIFVDAATVYIDIQFLPSMLWNSLKPMLKIMIISEYQSDGESCFTANEF